MPENAPVPLNRIERVLAGMIGAILAVALVAIVVVMIAAGTGSDMSSGPWPVLLLLGYLGLPIVFLMIVVFLVTAARRRRGTADGGR